MSGAPRDTGRERIPRKKDRAPHGLACTVSPYIVSAGTASWSGAASYPSGLGCSPLVRGMHGTESIGVLPSSTALHCTALHCSSNWCPSFPPCAPWCPSFLGALPSLQCSAVQCSAVQCSAVIRSERYVCLNDCKNKTIGRTVAGDDGAQGRPRIDDGWAGDGGSRAGV